VDALKAIRMAGVPEPVRQHPLLLLSCEVGWQVVRFDQSMRDDLGASGQQIRRLYQARL
jgi:hypothetical protein